MSRCSRIGSRPCERRAPSLPRPRCEKTWNKIKWIRILISCCRIRSQTTPMKVILMLFKISRAILRDPSQWWKASGNSFLAYNLGNFKLMKEMNSHLVVIILLSGRWISKISSNRTRWVQREIYQAIPNLLRAWIHTTARDDWASWSQRRGGTCRSWRRDIPCISRIRKG